MFSSIYLLISYLLKLKNWTFKIPCRCVTGRIIYAFRRAAKTTNTPFQISSYPWNRM